MADWEAIRDKAVAGLASVTHEGTRQAHMARARLQLSDIRAKRQDVLRDLGEAVLSAKTAGTPLEAARAGWEPIWSKLDALADQERGIQAVFDQEQAGNAKAPAAEARTAFCTQCGGPIAADAKFCSACGTAAPT